MVKGTQIVLYNGPNYEPACIVKYFAKKIVKLTIFDFSWNLLKKNISTFHESICCFTKFFWFLSWEYIEWTISRKITNAQCGNFRIFLSFRDFTWNQIENLQVLKSSFCHFRAPRFVHLVNFSFQKVQKFIQKSKLRASKCQNCGFWYTLNSPTLISRKNWVTEKFCKFQIPHCEDT